MSKPDMSSRVMQEITESKIRMRPHWYFTFLTAATILAIFVLSSLSVYLVNILTLTLRIQINQRPMYGARLKLADLLEQFPWWMVILAIASMIILVWLIRRRSSMYRYSIGWTIAAVLLLSLALGIVLSYTPINQIHIGPGQGSHNGQYQGQMR